MQNTFLDGEGLPLLRELIEDIEYYRSTNQFVSEGVLMEFIEPSNIGISAEIIREHDDRNWLRIQVFEVSIG